MRVSLLITTFNRPAYLKQCLHSLSNADLSKLDQVFIVDDASDSLETRQLIYAFIVTHKQVRVHNKHINAGIKDSLLYGFDNLFGFKNDLVINLDGDAIVRNDFVDRILELKAKYPELMVSGFNCNTLNANGTIRHNSLYNEPGAIFRTTVGGINLCINKEQYQKWVKPALTEAGNWDHNACLRSHHESLPIAVTVPSVVQHIGFESSMGHSEGGEPADVASDFKLLHLSQVTLVGVDCVDVDRLLKVADRACEQINFAAVKILSSVYSDDPRVIPIPKIASKEDYSLFMLKELADYIETTHLLIIQHDGQVNNPYAWRKEWLQYDYIGAVWHFGDPLHPVGNGGFSLRTRRLHEITRDDPNIFPMNEAGVSFHKEEDHVICRIFGEYLKTKYGIKFAPADEAEKFSIEGWQNPDPVYRGQFGFHGERLIFFKT